MPRDGSQEYHAPFPDVVEGTTIESTVYNGFVNDIVIDLNTPRPVKYGGTGADNPADAMQNLGGELSKQLVTNYDVHPFQAGSFYSAASASGTPTGNAFTGICYVAVIAGVATTDMFLEARDQTTGLLYVRQKKANVWGGWTVPAGFSPGPTPPVGSAPNALWWDTTRGKLFFYYQDPSGPPAQWVEAVAVPDIDPNTFVEIAGDSMTGFLTLNANAVNPLHAVPKQQLDARVTGLYAAPFDAMAYNGMQINGGFDVSQERGSAGTTVSGTWICDSWKMFFAGTMAIGGVQNANSITYGHPSFLSIQINTPQVSLGANDYVFIRQDIEWWRCARVAWGTIGAQPITLGFWTSHTTIGVYGGSIRNKANDRAYAFTYTQAVSNVPQYNTVTIPGDTTGAWNPDNTSGISVTFAMASGTGVTAPSVNTWVAGNYVSGPGQINGAVAGNIFRITGVVILPGIEAPSAARSPLIMRPYDQELLTCQRYYCKNFGAGTAAADLFSSSNHTGFAFTTTQLVSQRIFYPVRMRSDPTFLFYRPPSVTGVNGCWSFFNNSAWVGSGTTANTQTDTGFCASMALGPPVTANATYLMAGGWTADARL